MPTFACERAHLTAQPLFIGRDGVHTALGRQLTGPPQCHHHAANTCHIVSQPAVRGPAHKQEQRVWSICSCTLGVAVRSIGSGALANSSCKIFILLRAHGS